MAIEHIFAYGCQIFRVQDIRKNGKPDVYGVPRAKRESMLKTVETFYDCLLLGYTLKHLVSSSQTIHDVPFFTYWISMDIIIVFFGLGYNYLTKILQVSSEIERNLNTLYFC